MLQVRIVFIAILSLNLAAPSPVVRPQGALHNSLHHQADQAALDVKTTIEEVQKMLEMDSNLPRLTRGEIEDLFEQVTREEYEKSLKVGDFTRAKHIRALMLVLPYNTENSSSDNLQEIFNRPPVTKVISSTEVKSKKPQKVVVPSGRVEIISVDNVNPTTYKPFFGQNSYILNLKEPAPTTYRPNPNIIRTATTSEPAIFVTTTPSSFYEEKYQNPSSINNRFSSHYNAKKTDFIKESLFTSRPRVTPELEEILENLGFAAQSQSRKRFKLEEPDENLPKPVISSLIKQDRISVDEYDSIPETLTADDFKKSLIPEIRPEDYVAFKPLPIPKDGAKNIHPELEDYLKMYGIIGDRGKRLLSESQKPISDSFSLTTTTIPTTSTSLSTTSTRPIRIKRIDTNFEEQTYSPTSIGVGQDKIDNKDYIQLERLLKNIRQLQNLNVTLTDESFKKLDLKNYNFSQSILAQGPDPIDNTDTVDPLKNEVKRQSDNAEPTRFNLELSLDAENDTLSVLDEISSVSENSSSTTESTTTDTSTSTTTEAPRRAGSSGLDDDAFGGLDPVTEEPLPKPRKNGFYFLADWNSFLEVGEGDEQVVVRFNPKVGDPSRFIPVTVP